jgi:hypothetical protein
MLAQLAPGIQMAPGDIAWLEGGTIYRLGSGTSLSAAKAAAAASKPRLVLLSPGDVVTYPDGTTGTAGAEGALLELAPGSVVINTGAELGKYTIPSSAPIAVYDFNSSITLYTQGGNIILLEPTTNTLLVP